jgi:hypothetical protein
MKIDSYLYRYEIPLPRSPLESAYQIKTLIIKKLGTPLARQLTTFVTCGVGSTACLTRPPLVYPRICF